MAATRTDIARSNAGLAVKRGAPKPDISTTAAFKRALLDAKSICYVEQGATGIYLKGLFERLGIAEQLKGKTKLLPPSNPAAHAVANGEAEIGMTRSAKSCPMPTPSWSVHCRRRSNSPRCSRPRSGPVPRSRKPPRRSSSS